jgi:PAT family beta-lactamase induction signal transducer AmpG
VLQHQRSRTSHKLLFAVLYLSEGAPIGFIWWALPTKLRMAGVPVEEITTLTALLVLPWVFKFLWAPLVDALRGERWTFRSWIISAQVVMGASLLPLFFLDMHSQFPLVYTLLIVHAFAAATQDVSIDAFAINTVDPAERGALNGWMQAGMLVGRSVLGGGALMLEPVIGEQAVFGLLLACIWLPMLLLVMKKVEARAMAAGRNARERFASFTATLRAAAGRRTTWIGLLIAGISGAGFEAVGAVAGPFLIDRGFSQGEVGFFFLLPAISAMITGALAGGYMSDRMDRRISVVMFLGLLSAVIVLLAFVDRTIAHDMPHVLYGVMVLLYLCIGLFTASSYALFMDLTDPKLGGTQFSAYMGATNGCESWSSFAVGRVIADAGYPAGFLVLTGASLLAVPLLLLLPRSRGTGTKEEV